MSEQNESTALATRQGNAIADASTAREVQEVQAMMTIAKRFPRDEKAALDRIINACTRKGLADSACYQYSRGGTDITGPSIRLAEAIAQNWGNLQFGVRELEQRNGESTVEAFAWDLETNTRQVKTFQVKHERHTRMGAKALTDHAIYMNWLPIRALVASGPASLVLSPAMWLTRRSGSVTLR